MYYSAVLRIFASSLLRESDRITTQLWIKKLFGPCYHSTCLKPKRNKYLLYLTITLYNDETFGIFKQEPPRGKLPDLHSLPYGSECSQAAWEQETQWCDTLNDLPPHFKYSKCYLCPGPSNECPNYDERYGMMLDASFQYFLWLIRPYVALMTDPTDKTKAACWVQTLCGIAPEREDCPMMKEMRNDYLIALLGYVHDLRVEGPFNEMPPEEQLMPLEEAVKRYRETNPFNSPVGAQAEEFLSQQPLPQTGAFAYINVTGSLFEN
ncbi:UNVERIFIED_CONTAM: hypothetical protein PYX00_010645 [Menopon gallinae]